MATAFEQAIEMIRETNPDKADLLEAIHRAEVAEAKVAAAEAGQGGGSGDGNQGGKGGRSEIDWAAAIAAYQKRGEELAKLGGKKI